MNPDLPTLNSVAENQRNNFMLKTQTPQTEIKQADRPRYDVPIMIKITEEDRRTADKFTNPRGCLVCTALKRLGYSNVSVVPTQVIINNRHYNVEGITAEDLTGYSIGCHPYLPEVVGKQIILYPENT